MNPFRRLIKSQAARDLLPWIAARYIRLTRLTTRFTERGRDRAEAHWRAGTPFILAFWHGRMLLMAPIWPRRTPMHMLISHHRDGEYIARTMDVLGIGTVRGSSSKGGTQALRAMLKALAAGECVGITPDGPAGPRMRASAGIVAAARLSGAPILPATFAVSRRRVLGSWDRFVVALPFGRGVYLWGEEIRVPRDADAAAMEAARRRVEDELNRITAEADRLMGHAPIPPDDALPDGARPDDGLAASAA
jgi:lysophospholipid acyltransferase (LPLAT)-like uncharacterized protein